MRFTVQKKAFEKVLGKAAATVDHGKALPVLKGVLLEVLHDVLAVTAYDLEVAYEAALDVTQPTPGKALVDAAKISSIIRSLPEGEVRVEATKNRLVVSSGEIEFRLAILEVSDYPEVPSAGENGTAVSAQALHKALGGVLYAASTDATRYSLNGVFLQTEGASAVAVATDGHRLAKVEVPWNGPNVFGSILPRKAVTVMRSLLEGLEGNVTLTLKDRLVTMTVGDENVSLRLIDGQFPRWQEVVPRADQQQGTLVVDRKKLLEVLRRVAIVGSALKVDLGKMEVSTVDVDLGEAKESLPGNYEGIGVYFGINGGYLREALGAISAETVTLNVWDDVSPLVVKAQDEIALVMPMRV
jgi:DNA polymerase-3 subunit beta